MLNLAMSMGTMPPPNNLPIMSSQVQGNISNPVPLGSSQLAGSNVNGQLVPIANNMNNIAMQLIPSNLTDNQKYAAGNNTANNINGQTYNKEA
jgi:hypothetical protein